MIHTVIELRLQVNAPVGIRGKILNRIQENLIVPNDRQNIVRGVDGCDKKPDLVTVCGTLSRNKVAYFNRPENDYEVKSIFLSSTLDLAFLSYFESKTLAFCGTGNPFACSIRIRLTSWIVSGFPCTE